MQQRRLTENEYVKITKLLSSAVKDKHQALPEDLQRASVLFYSVNQLGFALVDFFYFINWDYCTAIMTLFP